MLEVSVRLRVMEVVVWPLGFFIGSDLVEWAEWGMYLETNMGFQSLDDKFRSRGF